MKTNETDATGAPATGVRDGIATGAEDAPATGVKDALGRFAPSEEVAHREVEGQVLLMLPDQSDLFTLNGTGALVWGVLVEGRPVAEAAEAIAGRYGVPLERARGDVAALVEALLDKNAIRPL